MHVLEVRVPPPAVALLTGGLMWGVAWTSPEFGFALRGREFLAGALAATGMVICGIGVAAFLRTRTTLNPMKPESSSTLVVSGLYKVTRNPMYLGMLLALAGWAFFISNVLAFLVLPGFVVYMNRFQIEPEERALASRFGDEFLRYAARVRRWI